MIRAIIFDYFGVICSDEYWNILKQDIRTSTEFHELANEVNLGNVHWEDFVRQIAHKTGRTVPEITKLYESERIHPNLVAYISTLHATYKTALLTNAHHEFLEPILAKAHMLEIFDAIIMSSRVGIVKPDPRIFLKALEKLSVAPDEAVFIDDSPRNTAAAETIGMKGVTYRSFEQLRIELSELLRTNTDE